MTIPESALGVLALLALLIPGSAFAYTRALLGGLSAADRNVQLRILQAVTASVALDGLYLAFTPSWFVGLVLSDRASLRDHPVAVGLGIVVYGLVVPGLVAVVLYYRPAWSWLDRVRPLIAWLEVFRRGVPYRAIPTAWDFAAPRRSATFVRVRTPEGAWHGGWFGDGSFVSTYPEPRDLFIAEQWAMGPGGEFKSPVPGSAGVWLRIDDGYLVEWLQDPGSYDEEESK